MVINAESFEDLSHKIARDFLHTVVVVDDDAEYESSINTNLTATLVSPGKSNSATDFEATTPQSPISHPLNAKTLMDTFAGLGMVCAILKPRQDEDFIERANHASRRADVLILDWQIGADSGGKTISTIRSVIAADEERLRLIVIYSGENLGGIFSKLEKELKDFNTSDSEKLEINYEFTKIVLLAKRQSSQNDYKTHTHDEGTLPDRVITEFRNFHMGLLSNAALKSISLVRANAHKILVRFRPELDAGFLSHRAFTTPPDESESHIGPLLLDEIHAILDNEKVSELLNIDTIRKWMENQDLKPRKSFRDRLGINERESVAIDMLVQLLDQGYEKLVKDLHLHKEKPKGNWQKLLHRILTPSNLHDLTTIWSNHSTTDAALIDKQLAYQMMNNRSYENSLPLLKLGTIVRRVDNEKLYLCIQPACDCVRIVGRREFTFLRLTDSTSAYTPTEVLIEKDNDFEVFSINYKPFQSTKIRFKADPARQCVLSKKAGDYDIFKSVESPQVDYNYVGQLKNQVANRILVRFGNEVSRLGLTESEWLRRSARV